MKNKPDADPFTFLSAWLQRRGGRVADAFDGSAG